MKRVKGPPEIVDGIYYPRGKAYGDPPRPRQIGAMGGLVVAVLLFAPFVCEALDGSMQPEKMERAHVISWIGAACLASFVLYAIFRYYRGKSRLERKLKDGI